MRKWMKYIFLYGLTMVLLIKIGYSQCPDDKIDSIMPESVCLGQAFTITVCDEIFFKNGEVLFNPSDISVSIGGNLASVTEVVDANTISVEIPSTFTPGTNLGISISIPNDFAGSTSDDATKITIIGSAPTPTISTQNNITNICQGGSLILEASSDEEGTYKWFLNGTVISGATSNTYTATEGGAYTVSVSVGSCESALSDPITIELSPNPPPTADITESGSTTFCEGGSLELIAETNATGTVTYQWLKDGETLEGATNMVLTVEEGGNYQVTISDDNECSKTSDEVVAIVNEKPDASIDAHNPEFCEGNTIVLSANTNVTNPQYQWFKDDSEISGETAMTLDVSEDGEYKVRVSLNGCATFSDSTIIKVKPNPDLSIDLSSLDIIKNSADTIMISAKDKEVINLSFSSSGFVSWQAEYVNVEKGDGNGSGLMITPNISLTNSDSSARIIYRITSVENGCQSKLVIIIDVGFAPPNIPCILTPYHDPNRIWKITAGGNAHDFKIRILNELGAVVFQSNKEGEWNGGNLPDGTYWYEVLDFRPNAKQERYTGTIWLQRQ